MTSNNSLLVFMSLLTIQIIILSLLNLFIPSTQSRVAATYSPSANIDAFQTCFKSHLNSSSNLAEIIHVSGGSSMDTILKAYIRNERFNLSTTPKPLAIITPLEESHVPPVVICAKENNLVLRIRSGGHDYEGLSYVAHEPFIVVDLFNLRSIEIDGYLARASVQAGATLGELYYAIAKKGDYFAFPAGVCATLGVGGHIGGGGYGNMIRKYGLSSDYVIDVKIVDANGKILNRKTMGDDVFWALKGGGPASFGIVLAWYISLVELPVPTVTVFKISRTLEQGATDLVAQWQEIAPAIDRNLFIRAQPIVKNNTVEVSFIGQYVGFAKTLLPLLNKELPLLQARRTDLIEMPWVNSTAYWFNLPDTKSLLERVSTRRVYGKYKSDYVTVPIPKTGLEEIWKKMIEVENISLQFNPYGGAMSEIPPDYSPFPHRKGILFKIQYLAQWVEPGAEIMKQHIESLNQVYDTFTPYVSRNPRQAFLNYRDLEIGTNADNGVQFGIDYFGENNFKRLRRIKTKLDPNNFFSYEQSIPPLRGDAH